MTDSAANARSFRAECQAFRQGCVGCCVNMRWKPARVLRYLEANTAAAEALFPARGRPGRRELSRLHRARGGWLDFVLAALLAGPTFGLSALLWRRYRGSCCFAGILDRASGRAGCLLHPARLGMPDLRRYAFPYVPTLGCDRALRCPMLDDPSVSPAMSLIAVSQAGFRSLRARKRKGKAMSPLPGDISFPSV